jgi:hypothetical protein
MSRYIPILRWKQGERRGLAQLQTVARHDVVPLIQVGPDQYRVTRAQQNAGRTAAQELANSLLTDWGANPFYLDASALAPSPGQTNHPLLDIAAAARANGLQMIPATSLSANQLYATAVRTVTTADSRGAALRIDLQELTTASTWSATWGHALSNIDLIADFRGTIATVLSLGAAAIAAFQNLHNGPRWRSVAVAGTSMPLDFSGYSAGVHLIPRSEWMLWQALSTAGLPYEIGYGDYATVSLAAAPPAIAWGYPINVKYTLQNEFLICRGVKTTGRGSVDMAPQLIGHAQTIRGYPTRARISACWADDMVDDIAVGAQGPGNLETWVRIGVNRHIERVRTDLP